MSKPQVKLDPQYRILPPHTEEERQVLEQAILTTGRVEPVIADKDLNVLDGFARAEIAEEHGIPYAVTVLPDLTEEQKREYIILNHVGRRHLNAEQRRGLVRLLRQDRKSLRQIARLTGVSVAQVHRDLENAPGMPDTIVGVDGVEHPARKPCSVVTKTAAEAAKCCRHLAQLDPEHLPNRDLDVRGLAKIVRKVESEKRDEELMDRYNAQLYDGTDETNIVRQCPIECLALEPESVDMVFCDPPYSETAIPLYEHLAILAKHVLKPGGMCIVYAGNWHLPKTMGVLAEHLEWVWTYIEVHPQSEQRIWEKNVLGKHRLLLGFRKPGETAKCAWVPDTLWTPKEKQHHEWQQAEAAPRRYIPAYTDPGDVVLDPFSGGGTTPAVCKALGRRYLAFDADPIAVAKTLARLETVTFEGFADGEGPEDPEDGPDGGPSASPDDDADDAKSISCNAAESEVGACAPTSGGATPAAPSALSIHSSAPGQLTATFEGTDTVVVSRPGISPVVLPVEYVPLTNRTFIKPNGNDKTFRWMGVIGGISQGCLGTLTGFPKSDIPCFSDPDGRCGCYAATNQLVAQRGNQRKRFSIVSNGIHNDCLKIRLPLDDYWCLTGQTPNWIGDQPMRWRVDAESADGSMSVALGFIQRWAQSNQSMHFITMSADHFVPDDDKLDWAGGLDNLIVGHTVSAWFSPEENQSRLASAERYKRHGINTVIWICTDRAWPGNEDVLQQALEIVPPTHIIEVPHSRAKLVRAHESPFLGLPACQTQRRDMLDRRVRVIQDGARFRYEALLPDGTTDAPYKGVHGRCWGCQVKCGETAVFGGTPPNDPRSEEDRNCSADRPVTSPVTHDQPNTEGAASASQCSSDEGGC